MTRSRLPMPFVLAFASLLVATMAGCASAPEAPAKSAAADGLLAGGAGDEATTAAPAQPGQPTATRAPSTCRDDAAMQPAPGATRAPPLAAFAGNVRDGPAVQALASRFARGAGDQLGAPQDASSWTTSAGRLSLHDDPAGGDAMLVRYERAGSWRDPGAPDGGVTAAVQALLGELGADGAAQVVADGPDGATVVQGTGGARLTLGTVRLDAASGLTRLELAAVRDLGAAPALGDDAAQSALARARNVAACLDPQDATPGRWPIQAAEPPLGVADGTLVHRFERAPGLDWSTAGAAGDDGAASGQCPAGWSMALDVATHALVAWESVPCASHDPSHGGV